MMIQTRVTENKIRKNKKLMNKSILSVFKRITMIKTKYFFFFPVIMVFICGCSPVKIDEEKPIKIGVDIFPGWAHLFIAEEKGYFNKNGVDVEIVLNEDYLTIQKQFANNELDGAFMVYADAIYSHAYGYDPQVVYISDYSITGDVIAAQPEFGSITDLAGKTIGVDGINSFSHLFVLAVLQKHGMEEGDFFIKNVGAQEVVDALERGDIAAGHTYGPGKFMAKQKGYTCLAFAGDVEGIITDILAFHKKIVKMRPADIKAIVKSLFEAKRFQENNRKEAIEIIAKAIHDTPDSVREGIDAVHYVDLESSIHAMFDEELEEEGMSLIESGKFITDFYLKRGQLSSIPDFNEIIEPRFVDELAGERKEDK